MYSCRFLASNSSKYFGRRLLSTTQSKPSRINNKKKCFLFPGMGSQYTGMCKDLYDDFKYIKCFLEECNELLGFSVTNIMWNSEPKELQQPAFAGISIFVHSMCIWKILEREYEIDKILSDNHSSIIGHSAGEYSALSVANVFKTFKDALYITNFYGKCMQQCSAKDQAMYAVIGENEIDLELLQYTVHQHNVDIANINTANQIIISGLRNNIDAVIQEFNDDTDYKIKGKYLQTGGAYHSRFMKPVSNILKEAFNSVELNDSAKCDLYLNVIGDKYNNHDIGSIMSQQLYDQVHWYQCIQNYFAENESEEDQTEYNFIEIGPKKVLKNMVQYICKYHEYDQHKNINVLSIGTTESIASIQTIL